VRIWEGRRLPWRRQYLRAPIRGRDPDEARERALEVLRTHVGLDGFRLMAETVARGTLPGAGVAVSEDAREIVVTLTGRYALEVPLAIPRHEVLDQAADLTQLRGLVKAHLESYARPR
jgi:hypothetical protein